jgi:hypothetical protein
MKEFAERNYKHLKSFELITLGTILVLLGLSNTLSFEIDKIIGALALVNVIPYYLLSRVVLEFEDSGPLNTLGRTWVISFVMRLYYFAFMVLMFGIFINTIKLPDNSPTPFLYVSGITLFFCLFAAIFAQNTIKRKFYTPDYFIRIGLGIFLVFRILSEFSLVSSNV